MSRLLDRILRDPVLASRLGPVENLPVIDASTHRRHHPSVSTWATVVARSAPVSTVVVDAGAGSGAALEVGAGAAAWPAESPPKNHAISRPVACGDAL